MNTFEKAKEAILGRLEEAEEEGRPFHWVKPWEGGSPWACNHTKPGTPYRGINALILGPGEYLTFNQFKKLQEADPGIKMKKGSKGKPLFFFTYKESKRRDDADGEETEPSALRRRPVFKRYTVFDLSCFEGIKAHYGYTPRRHSLDESLHGALLDCACYAESAGIGLSSVPGSGRAYYSPLESSVVVPDIEQFESKHEYFSTLFHELVHSTAGILGRKGGASWGDEGYAKEELVAEIGASMLCAHYRIDDDSTAENSIAYIRSWKGTLKSLGASDVVYAANQAQKACDLIVGKAPCDAGSDEGDRRAA